MILGKILFLQSQPHSVEVDFLLTGPGPKRTNKKNSRRYG